jgi:hypothetical protein
LLRGKWRVVVGEAEGAAIEVVEQGQDVVMIRV